MQIELRKCGGELQLFTYLVENALRGCGMVWALKTGPSLGSGRIKGEGALSTCHVIRLFVANNFVDKNLWQNSCHESESTTDVTLTALLITVLKGPSDTVCYLTASRFYLLLFPLFLAQVYFYPCVLIFLPSLT